MPASGASGSFTVAAGSGCSWTAASGAFWLHITAGGSGNGAGAVDYTADANSGPERSGGITVEGQVFTVNQAGVTAPQWLPAVIHKDVPSRNAWWRSDVALLNRSGNTANVTLTILAPSGTKTQTMQVGANSQAVLRDVAGQLGISADSGALEVHSEQGLYGVMLTGRTYSQVDATHTYGQDYDSQGPELMNAGDSGWLPQLTQNANYRTNIGITNTGTANVTVTLYDSNGNLAGWSDTRDYAPGQFFQHDQPFLHTPAGAIDSGYAVVTVNSGSGVVAYASVIDQQTGDPTTIKMRR